MSVRNILKIFDKATADECEAGRRWYADAQASCEAISRDLQTPMILTTGVVSALSPNNRWERNLQDARSLIHGHQTGLNVDDISVATYHANRAKAWRILDEAPASQEDVRRILRGPKTVAFYRCIMGEDVCVVDGHAYNIWRGERHALSDDKTNIGKRLRETVVADYVRAAKRRALAAYEMQAITWTTWRRVHGIA